MPSSRRDYYGLCRENTMAYTVKQVAEMSGVSVRTLHFYDQTSLLKPAYHGANGYRFYGEYRSLFDAGTYCARRKTIKPLRYSTLFDSLLVAFCVSSLSPRLCGGIIRCAGRSSDRLAWRGEPADSRPRQRRRAGSALRRRKLRDRWAQCRAGVWPACG